MRLLFRRYLLLLGAATLWTGHASRANAQELAPGAIAVEMQVSARQLNGRQQPHFTSFHSSDYWIFIDSARRSLRLPFERGSLFEGYEGPLSLPATKLWDVVPTVH